MSRSVWQKVFYDSVAFWTVSEERSVPIGRQSNTRPSSKGCRDFRPPYVAMMNERCVQRQTLLLLAGCFFDPPHPLDFHL